MKPIPRLTKAMVDRAQREGKVAGWYALCRAGYLPGEIHVYDQKAWPISEVCARVREYARGRELPVPANCARIRPYVRKTPVVEDCRAAFRASVMRTGLALVLTQPMLERLCAVACDAQSDTSLYFQALGGVRPDNSIATGAALLKRGLIDNERRLTPIGERVVALLKEAGVFVVPDSALKGTG